MTDDEYNVNIELWAGNVLRFSVWNCGDHMRGEDAMQEAFARLWEKRGEVTVEHALGFLLTVARRYLVDCFRHDCVVETAHQELARGADEGVECLDDGMDDEMVRALRQLPELQRTIMQLRDVEGYSYKEIAQMLQISDQQVQVYLFRARSKMKKLLATYRR